MVGWLDLPGFLCEQRNARGGRFGNVRHGVTDLASKQPARGKVVYRLQNVLVVECAFGRPLCGVGVLGNDARHLTHVALGLDVESYQLPVTSVFPPNLVTELVALSHKVQTHFSWRPNLRDESDNKFVDAAVHASAIVVTYNTRHFDSPDLPRHGWGLMRPRELVARYLQGDMATLSLRIRDDLKRKAQELAQMKVYH